MCKYKTDYLKTLALVQKDLGSPSIDYELTHRYITIPNFVGFSFPNEEKYLPKEVEFDNSDDNGKLFMAKFNGINYVNIVYTVKHYYVLLQLVYNYDTKLYELKSCKDAFYDVDYELSEDSLTTLQVDLDDWRPIIINAKAPAPYEKPRHDVIDTTHFSANLNCELYEWNKEDYDDSVRKLMNRYPKGIPVSDDGRILYHIHTYHIENGEVPYSPLYVKDPEFEEPPRYIPPQKPKPKKSLKRRDDF